ncbi:4'-phosphopantetheinyl transferase superfamily protein [Salinisphaera sp. Q1T1-3]|uniref:4'-phosphopantetheinyl transferase family protein n=1 Tax=Salinisphaera sp. Q1T1-3 TaxID=2321229 RepID=UPI000E72B273|nr:hypothetical protein [Salinisphaera sp. Q1T1-3]RJS92500.1 hypothetical protein D3260_11250 [Salinisphaera sp. Q1T1-3]
MRVFYILLNQAREARFAATASETLPSAYRDRVAAMTSPAARARTVAGLWLLGRGLAATGDDAARLARIGFSATGRPEIAGGPWFSISHSGALVACAVSAIGPIGLDVEQRRDGISSRLVSAIAAETHDFFAAWCAREATVKASGRVGLARVRAITLTADRARLDGQDWPLAALGLSSGYAGCLAVAPDAGAALSRTPACVDLTGAS